MRKHSNLSMTYFFKTHAIAAGKKFKSRGYKKSNFKGSKARLFANCLSVLSPPNMGTIQVVERSLVTLVIGSMPKFEKKNKR